MNRKEASIALTAHRKEIAALERKMREVRAQMEPEPVADYEFSTVGGKVRLSELFGRHSDLVVVHNMGIGCAYCTLWADGYNGIYHHLAERAAFVIASPDAPAEQERIRAERGWRFPMISHAGSTFSADMGFVSPEGKLLPGLSSFQKEGGRVLHLSDAESKPGDAYCTLYHIFDLLPGGAADFRPKRAYG